MTTEQPKCELCGEPMPPGEEMFKIHGYSGNCPKPPLPIAREQELKQIIEKARTELDDIECSAKIKAMSEHIGKCFKYRNCYSCHSKPEDYWWLYIDVIGVNGSGSLVTNQFQRDKYGNVEVKIDESMTSLSSHIEIQRDEYLSAWQEVQAVLVGINAR